MPANVDQYVEENRERFLAELIELLRIPSISTLPEHQADVQQAADHVAARLAEAGLDNVEVIPTERHPLVYGEWLGVPGKPTVLCYGHYDVQPPDPLEEWETPPFEPALRNGNLYARGAADDKGQMYTHIKAVEALRAVTGTLPVNIKFLIEGEEEVGGASIARYVADNGEKLRADVALVSDTAMYAEGMPSLCTGLRGLIYAEVSASGPARDLHSGLYGGAAPNAVYGLIELLAKAKDDNGFIRIPDLYEDVEPPAPEEKASWQELPFDESEFLEKEVGAPALI
ncbi:MAG TPA: M20/M25/M40 family metallo-hydrolase, partial [Bryobacterales bacterium]|nr:M20/M25/M40 family metallo-hydrolase [Bryobacterales bacterium]